MTDILLTADSASLQFSLTESARRSEELVWIPCTVVVKVGTVQAQVSTNITDCEILEFVDEVNEAIRMASGRAAFMSLEGLVEFDVTVRTTGAVIVSGKAMLEGFPKAKLDFEFESNVSDIGRFSNLLGAASRTLREID